MASNCKVDREVKVIVFIDNLDRCMPDIVLNLLEDISAFLKITGVPCIYVLAMDKEHVVKAVNQRYPGFGGTHYLEKIIQVGLSMPKIEQPDKWMEHFQKRLRLSVQGKTSLFGFDSKLILDEMVKLSGFLCNGGILDNPRRVEKLVNKYLVLLAMDKINYQEKQEDVSYYIFCILLKEYFSGAYNALKTEQDIGYLDHLIMATRQYKTPEQERLESQKPGANVLNKKLLEEYGNLDFYYFLKSFTISLPSEGSVFAKKILEIKEKLDLVD